VYVTCGRLITAIDLIVYYLYVQANRSHIRMYASRLPFLRQHKQQKHKRVYTRIRKGDNTGHINTVTSARSKAMLPSPLDPWLTKEAAPVEGLMGVLELTNCAPQVKSIMAAAVV
jgi:hypothetical protein